MSYAVKEIYYTLQGEGVNACRPAVVLRFAGGNLRPGHEADGAAVRERIEAGLSATRSGAGAVRAARLCALPVAADGRAGGRREHAGGGRILFEAPAVAGESADAQGAGDSLKGSGLHSGQIN